MDAKKLFNSATQKFQEGDYREAINEFRQSLALREDWRSYLYLGIAYISIEQYQSAILSFKKSLAIKDNWQSYYGLGTALLNGEEYESAVVAFNHSLILKQSWQSFQGLGMALHKMQKFQLAINAFENSISLEEEWESYQGLGTALINLQQYQSAVDALEHSISLKEDMNTSRYLGEALLKLGKADEATQAIGSYYRNNIDQYHLKIDTCLGEKEGFSVAREIISGISNDLSRFGYTFHPSFFIRDQNDKLLQSWQHMIHVHIPKCAGTSFEAPLNALPEHISRQLKNTPQSNNNQYERRQYLWHGNLGMKILHDAYIKEVLKRGRTNEIQGSFVTLIGSKHGEYHRNLLKLGLSAKKICLVRNPAKRLYSHIRHNGRISKNHQELLNRCINNGPNLMDRYIYDYSLFENHTESPYCQPFDYEQCNSIDFVDITDKDSISQIKSSFLTATLMPNVVQHNRLNDDKEKKYKSTFEEQDFQKIYKELISKGFLERDNQIDLEYLKKKTRERLQFPEIIHKGDCLHPITFIYPKTGTPKIMLTQDFMKDPLSSIKSHGP